MSPLEFEFTYYDNAVEHISHYTKGILPHPSSGLLESRLSHRILCISFSRTDSSLSFVKIFTFYFLVQFLVDHFPCPIMPTLVSFFCQFGILAYYVISHFISVHITCTCYFVPYYQFLPISSYFVILWKEVQFFFRGILFLAISRSSRVQFNDETIFFCN